MRLCQGIHVIFLLFHTGGESSAVTFVVRHPSGLLTVVFQGMSRGQTLMLGKDQVGSSLIDDLAGKVLMTSPANPIS